MSGTMLNKMSKCKLIILSFKDFEQDVSKSEHTMHVVLRRHFFRKIVNLMSSSY